jgi:hypothetical protein
VHAEGNRVRVIDEAGKLFLASKYMPRTLGTICKVIKEEKMINWKTFEYDTKGLYRSRNPGKMLRTLVM